MIFCAASLRRELIRVAALAMGLAPGAAHAAGWGGSLGAVSDNVFRGVTQSDGEPSVHADLHYGLDLAPSAGGFAGIWAASNRQDSAADPRAASELDLYLGYAWSFGEDWSARATLIRYGHPSSQARRYDYSELIGTASWQDQVFLTVAASPDKSAGWVRHQPAYNYELAGRWPIAAGVSAKAGVGYYDLPRELHFGYAYWNAAASFAWRSAGFELSYIGTDTRAADFYGDLASSRVVASVLWRF